MPSIVDRSPLVIAISTGGASPILGRMLKARLESLIPAAYGRLASSWADSATRSPRRSPLRSRAGASGRRSSRGRSPNGRFRATTRAAAAELARAIERAASENAEAPRGEVYLVGAGPGDPDLLTFRALRLMQKADVVLYDRLTDKRVMNLVRREAERIYVGKQPDDHELPQGEISALLVKLAREGKRVLRLKGGDPFMFGRGGEEIEALAAEGIPFQVCPGITAAIGAAAYAGIPLTHRDHAQACVFVTGHGKDGKIDLDWTALLQPRQTVAIYMGLRNVEALTREFIARGADADLPAAIIDNATRPNQRVVVGTLGTLAAKARAAELSGPSIIIVGTVVTLRDTLDWRPATEPRCRPRGRCGGREGLRWFLATRSWRRWRRFPARTGARPCPILARFPASPFATARCSPRSPSIRRGPRRWSRCGPKPRRRSGRFPASRARW